jgi:hypothetical protein
MVRDTCPNTEVCSGGTWIAYSELECNACAIVYCPIDFPDCCSGFRPNAYTALTFQPNPSAIKSFTTTSTSVTATFQFSRAGEIGSIDLYG